MEVALGTSPEVQMFCMNTSMEEIFSIDSTMAKQAVTETLRT